MNRTKNTTQKSTLIPFFALATALVGSTSSTSLLAQQTTDTSSEEQSAVTQYLENSVVNPDDYDRASYEPGGVNYNGPYGRGLSQGSSNTDGGNITFKASQLSSASGGEAAGLVSDEVLERLKVNHQVTPETTDLLGERIDLASGSVSFTQTDVSIPGNSGIPVSFTRSFKGKNYAIGSRIEFGDWQIDVPSIQTTLLSYAQGSSAFDYSSSWGKGYPCSQELQPDSFTGHKGTNVNSWEFWNGDKLVVPGVVNEPLMENKGANPRLADPEYKRISKSNWRFKCEPYMDNSQPHIQLSERFIGHAPDGLIYTFDKLKLVRQPPLVKGDTAVERSQAFMQVSSIEDRFGNKVTYHYDSNANLTSIVANDEKETTSQRTITISYKTHLNKAVVDTVQAHGRTWTYNYHPDKLSLKSVTRPDGKLWEYDLNELVARKPESQGNATCGFGGPSTSLYHGTVKHPDGMTGQFSVKETLHGRSNVKFAYHTGIQLHQTQACYATMSLKQKTLTGPGLDTLTWNYDYSQNKGYFDKNQAGETTIPDTEHKLDGSHPGIVSGETHLYKTTTVSAPDGSKTMHYFNRDATSVSEGSEVMTRYLDSADTELKRIEKHYIASAAIGQFFKEFDNSETAEKRSLLTRTEIVQSTNTYITLFAGHSLYGTPATTTESNSFSSNTRYTSQSYHHETEEDDFWLINMPTITEVGNSASDKKEVKKTTYYQVSDTEKALPKQELSLGNVTRTYTSYNDKGQLTRMDYTAVDGRYIKFADYKRGEPTTITLPTRDGSGEFSVSRNIDDNGWVTQSSDLNGNITNYTYDNIGRIKSINVADSKWSDSLFTWSVENTKPVRTVSQCTLSGESCTATTLTTKTTFDGLFRPLLVQSTDELTGANDRYVNSTYNAYGKPLFVSHPSDATPNSYGTTYTYDALQREKTISRSGMGKQSINYLAGNIKKITSQQSGSVSTDTETTYQAFGSPAYDQALTIYSEEGVVTTIDVDVWGKVNSITQSDKNDVNVSSTEARIYDANHQLCKTIRQDVGTTIYNNNIYGETQWMISGDSNSNHNCVATDTANKVEYSYDKLGSVKSITYPDAASHDLAYTRDNQGNVKQIKVINSDEDSPHNFTQNFTYYSNHAIKSEELIANNRILTVGYDYNAQGALSRLTYPNNGPTLTISNNGFGEPKSVNKTGQNYATSGIYYPSGQLKSFTYGNGYTHTTTIDPETQLPTKLLDQSSSTGIVDKTYAYDNHGNITAITDGVNSAYSISSITYDLLDRLKTVTGDTGIGNSSLSYDALGNITSYVSKDKSITYGYTNNRLTSIEGSKLDGRAFNANSYDSRGNVIDNGKNMFVYNRANQMVYVDGNSYQYDGMNRRIKTETADGKKELSFYSQSGRLLYREADIASGETTGDAINYIYFGSKLIAKDGVMAAADTKSTYSRPYGDNISEGDVASDKDGIGYTGHKFDKHLDLVYMQARYYDPVIGRFYSNDPVGFVPGNVHSFGRYTYANNNPYKYTDPDGNYAESVWDAASLSVGVVNLANNLSEGNFGAAALDAAGVLLDGAALALPIVPGGAGMAINASRQGADFIATADGAVVHNSTTAVRESLEGAGMSGTAVTNKAGTEAGTIHNVPDMKMDVRVMDGGPNHPPRVVTSRQGSSQPVNPADGKNFGNMKKAEQRAKSHIEVDK